MFSRQACVLGLFLLVVSTCLFLSVQSRPLSGSSLSSPATKLDCYVCDAVVSWVDSKIDGNSTENEIKAILDAACRDLNFLKNLTQKCETLVNEHSNYIIQLLEEELTPDEICDSLGLCSVNKTSPQFAHLALTGNQSEMSVTWMTYLSLSTNSLVRWSEQPNGPFSEEAIASSSTYLPSAGYNYKAVMNNLKPDTTYYYTCGNDEGGWSNVFSFTTQPAQNEPFTIIMYGDQGVHNSETTMSRVKDLVSNKQVDWIYHVGDISYADDYLGNIYNYVLDEWFGDMETVTSALPYMTCPGNHEYSCEHPECISYSKNFTAYNHRFRMPGNESGSNTSMFFSFDYSFVHFISISTETDYPDCPYPPIFGDQISWLKADLQKANANRDQVPWIVVIGHRPIYSSGVGQELDGIPVASGMVQNGFEEIFYENKVDLYIAGHVHSYERMFPTYENKPVATDYNDPQATVYLINGAGGCIEEFSDWVPQQPDWSAHRYNLDHGYSLLKVYNSTALEWQFYRSSDNGLEDSVLVTKGN